MTSDLGGVRSDRTGSVASSIPPELEFTIREGILEAGGKRYQISVGGAKPEADAAIHNFVTQLFQANANLLQQLCSGIESATISKTPLQDGHHQFTVRTTKKNPLEDVASPSTEVVSPHIFAEETVLIDNTLSRLWDAFYPLSATQASSSPLKDMPTIRNNSSATTPVEHPVTNMDLEITLAEEAALPVSTTLPPGLASYPAEAEAQPSAFEIQNQKLSGKERAKSIGKGVLKAIGGTMVTALLPATAFCVGIGALIGCACYRRNIQVAGQLTKGAIVGNLLAGGIIFQGAFSSIKEAYTGSRESVDNTLSHEDIHETDISIKVSGKSNVVPLKLYKTTVKANGFVNLFSTTLNQVFGRLVYFGTNRAIRTVRNRGTAGDIFSDAGLATGKEKMRNYYQRKDKIVKNMDLMVSGERIDGLFIQTNASPNAPTAIYFPGAGDFYECRKDMVDYYADLGMNVIVFNYRGYGHSGGSISTHDSLAEDAEAVFQYAKSLGIDPSNLLVHGHSLGGMIAADLMSNHPEINYLADRAPSDLIDVLQLRSQEHENAFFKELSSWASALIQQLGQNMSPKARIASRLHNQGKLGNVFCIECQDDRTLYSAKVGSFGNNIIPPQNLYLTDNVKHGGKLLSIERAVAGEFLTRENLVTSFEAFFEILINPSSSSVDLDESLAIWQRTIYSSDDPALITKFNQQLVNFKAQIAITLPRLDQNINLKVQRQTQLKQRLARKTLSRLERSKFNKELHQVDQDLTKYQEKRSLCEKSIDKLEKWKTDSTLMEFQQFRLTNLENLTTERHDLTLKRSKLLSDLTSQSPVHKMNIKRELTKVNKHIKENSMKQEINERALTRLNDFTPKLIVPEI